jgi:hypothetical protein
MKSWPLSLGGERLCFCGVHHCLTLTVLLSCPFLASKRERQLWLGFVWLGVSRSMASLALSLGCGSQKNPRALAMLSFFGQLPVFLPQSSTYSVPRVISCA